MNTVFRTVIETPKSDLKIDHSQRLFFAGSCFAENIAQRMQKAKFTTCCNPFGVLYNPLSIANMVEVVSHKKVFSEADLTLSKDGVLWCSFSFHGSFSSENQTDTLEKINSAVVFGADCLSSSDIVVLTFGTAWIYQLSSTQKTVANCHKFPSSLFNRRLLTVDEIVETYDRLINTTLKNKRVILTVSPIRHLKDGLHENTISKAILHLAIKELVSRYENIVYFPSYEIMVDDLRDYRFFAEDMVHPSKLAIDYIWSIYSNSFFSEKTKGLVKEAEQIAIAMNHRPFNPDSIVHEKFKQSCVSRIYALQERVLFMDFSRELEYFKS